VTLKLIVGLGNPGQKYEHTLHNVGFEVVDELAKRHGVTSWQSRGDALTAKVFGPGDGMLLVKPLTFMNVSGRAVSYLSNFFKIPVDDLLIIVDDVNLPAGQLRARPGGSAGGHNGLKSIIAELGTDAFPRLRVGVGRGDPRRNLSDHVLGRVPEDLRDTLAVATATAADATELFITHGMADVMSRFNTRMRTKTSPDEQEPAGDD
jgi:PTH1 family peptidyl-tRNA hydrolase